MDAALVMNEALVMKVALTIKIIFILLFVACIISTLAIYMEKRELLKDRVKVKAVVVYALDRKVKYSLNEKEFIGYLQHERLNWSAKRRDEWNKNWSSRWRHTNENGDIVKCYCKVAYPENVIVCDKLNILLAIYIACCIVLFTACVSERVALLITAIVLWLGAFIVEIVVQLIPLIALGLWEPILELIVELVYNIKER